MVLLSQAMMIVVRFLFSGIDVLCHGDTFNSVISFSNCFVSFTKLISPVARSMSFSCIEVMSQLLESNILRDVFRGPRKMPMMSKDCGHTLLNKDLLTTRSLSISYT